MLKVQRTLIVSVACIMFAFAGRVAQAEEAISDDEYHNPEIAAQQSEEWNPETGQFELPLVFGDKDDNLVYTPVTPCRLVDTREAAATGAFNGPISGGTTLAIDTDGNTLIQGGNPAGCGTYNNVSAIVVTVTAAGATSGGHFQVMPHLGSLPNASVLNFSPGQAVANTTIVPQNYSGLNPEIDLYVGDGTTHVIVDVVGYSNPPQLAAPSLPSQQVMYSGLISIAAGAAGQYFSPACPSGYRLTGGGTGRFLYTSDVQIVTSRPSNGTSTLISGFNVADRWMGDFWNNTGSSQSVFVYAVCIRVNN